MAKTALVSSCLLGLPTRYDGTDNLSQQVVDYLSQSQLIPIPVCPEQLAGMSTPRPKCWFTAGDGIAVLNGQGQIRDEFGQDATNAFTSAAEATYRIAKLTDCQLAILKQRSPSCGSRKIYLADELVSGMGVTAARLQQAGLKILSEEDFEEQKSPEK